MNGCQILEEYERLFCEQGGFPDSCEGVLWSREWLEAHQEATGDLYIRALAEEAVTGWSLSMLRLCWDVLTETQRLALMRSVPDWALKSVCGWTVFPRGLSEAEKDLMREALHSRRAVNALARLEGAAA